MKLLSSDYICIGCGLKLKDVSDYWVRSSEGVVCPICGSQDKWKKMTPTNKDEIARKLVDPDLWKKMLVAGNPLWFRRGRWELSRNMEDAIFEIDEMARSRLKKDRDRAAFLRRTLKLPVKDEVLLDG